MGIILDWIPDPAPPTPTPMPSVVVSEGIVFPDLAVERAERAARHLDALSVANALAGGGA